MKSFWKRIQSEHMFACWSRAGKKKVFIQEQLTRDEKRYLKAKKALLEGQPRKVKRHTRWATPGTPRHGTRSLTNPNVIIIKRSSSERA